MNRFLGALVILSCALAVVACEQTTLIVDNEEVSIDSVNASRTGGDFPELVILASNGGLFFLPGADTGTSFRFGVGLSSIEDLAESGPLSAEFGVDIELGSLTFGGPTDSTELISATATGTLSIDDVSAEKWEGDISMNVEDAVFQGGGRSFTTARFESYFIEM